MQITPITAQHQQASLQLITTAFATAAHSDGHEAELVAKLRQSATYHPDYDVVALNDDGVVVGHALLSQALVAERWPVFVLAPLAVHPDWQHRGIGGALITYLEVQAGEDARRGISILGDPAYYGRFGYRPAAEWQITPPQAWPSANFMFKELVPGSMHGVSGTLTYDPAFGL